MIAVSVRMILDTCLKLDAIWVLKPTVNKRPSWKVIISIIKTNADDDRIFT